jgi:dipeptidyl aminopeptidase/acylaminoacyl peptidase/CubicO group peptidase (beta-lactamase class C family)
VHYLHVTRPLELDDLYSIRTPADPQLSPDGKTLAFTLTWADREADADRSSIWALAVEGGEPTQLTRGDNDGQPRWAPDGSALAFVSAREDDPPQIWLLPAGGGEARRLTDEPLGASDPTWSPDASTIAFTAVVDIDHAPGRDPEDAAAEPIVISKLGYKADGMGRLRGLRQHVFTIGLDGDKSLQITNGDYFASGPVWSPDGREIAFSASTADDADLTFASAVHVVSSAGGEPRRVTPKNGVFAAVDWSPDGRTLLLAGAERVAVGHTALLSVAAEGGAPRRLMPSFDRNVMAGAPGYPGATPRFVDDGRAILFCARERGRVHVLQVPAEGGDPQTVVAGDRIVGGLSEAAGRIVFVAATVDSPGEAFVVSGGVEKQVTNLFRESLPDVGLLVSEQRSFVAPDGTGFEGWILKGAANGPGPLLLDIHGGPHNAWGPTFDPVHLYHQTLAAQGWTILYVNSRGSDGYGEAFWSALVAEGWGRADEQDFLAAVDAVVDEGLADPDRIALTGYSYGGEMTCWLSARSDRFAAAVAGGCVSNMVSMSGTSDFGWAIRAIELGRPSYDDASLVELSPLTHVSSVTAPTLILHGAADDRCPAGQAEEWFTALRSRGVPVSLVLYPDASHLFILSGRPSHRIDYCKRVEAWVTKYAGERTEAITPRSPATALRGFRSRFERARERHRVPGASIAILDRGDVTEVAAGILNVATGARARPDSVFQIGSITKPYTATLVMRLVDEGLLDLDSPIVATLPEFRVADDAVTKTVTMRHLLSHTSGIQGDHFPDTGRGDDCLEKFVVTCADLGQNHPLGATMSYCNTGYVVAGRVIERLTGTSWDEALRERLLQPLGTERTVTLPEEVVRFDTAFGHVVEPGRSARLAPAWMLPRSCGPAGLICSTASEVLAFARLHLSEERAANGAQVLSPGSMKAMQQEQVAIPDPYTLGSHWGLGWILFDWSGRRLLGHDGNTIGQSAFLRIDPEAGIAVALLTNGGNARDLFRDVYGEIFGSLVGVDLPRQPEPLDHPPPFDADRYVGTYERVASRIEIVERDGGLVATSTVTGPLAKLVPKTTKTSELRYAGDELFVTRDEGQENWTPVVFFDLPDGTRCIHMGARATPRIS